MMMKRLVIVLVVLAAVAAGAGIWWSRMKTTGTEDDGVRVAVSFYPLEFLAGEIGGDKVSVTNLTPAGAEPHDWEPTTADAAMIEKSQLLLVNGGGLEAWAGKVTAKKIVAVGEGLIVGNDPHIWLDPVLFGQEADRVAAALGEIDPQNKDVYEDNNSRVKDELALLDEEYKTGLENCAQKNIVTSHAAFGYLAKRYGLTETAISGISPDEEPTAQKLAQTATLVKNLGIKYIFFETLVSPRLAQTLAQETGAQTIVFNPLEGLTEEQQQAGLDYFSVMRENLVNLKMALECRKSSS